MLFLQVRPAISSASSSILLTDLLAKQYKETDRAELTSFYRALQLIDGQLWCGVPGEIHVYSKNLHRERVIKLWKGMEFIGGIAEVDDDMVAAAAWKCLVVINRKGRDYLFICAFLQ